MPAPTPIALRLRDTEDRTLSPFTGWTRDTWALLCDEMLLAARRHATPRKAGIVFPGATGGYGARVDALEGFARTFLAAGFRVAGEDGRDPHGFLDWYAAGLAAGVDPASPERWVRLREHDQAKVEAASVALVLHLTRPWLWDALAASVQEQVVDYLSDAVGDTFHSNNWLWFQIVIETFLDSVGAPASEDDIGRNLARLEGWAHASGWYADGDTRAYDHYAGWALQFYPLLWIEMAGDAPLAVASADRLRIRADRYLHDAVRLLGADGAPLLQGRSLTYRFATAAPFWAGARAGVGPQPGLVRRAASGIAKHFVGAGAPNAEGLLDLGWHGPWRPIAQSYSGPGSPYWASKGLLGLSLPADHPVWTEAERPLPAEREQQAELLPAPGWLVSSSPNDGIVRVVNHGTDWAREGDRLRDSPLYARLGYTTATSPLLTGEGVEQPFDDAVVLLDAGGRATSRTGFTRGELSRTASGTMVGSSQGLAHWVNADGADRDLGGPRTGTATQAAVLRVVSFVRGDWEVRLAQVGAGERGTALRFGATAAPEGAGLHVELRDLGGLPVAGIVRFADATPLAARTSVHWRSSVGTPVEDGWYAAALAVGRRRFEPAPQLDWTDGVPTRIRWADGANDDLRVR